MIIKDKIYGNVEIIDSLALELINTKEMQRLKDINQNSTFQFLSKKFNTSRFEHCVGVYYLLKKFNAPYEEQIAGLIHDISHFAFSHVMDYVLGDPVNQEKQDEKHRGFLINSSIPEILKRFNLDFEYITNENNFPMLGNKIPDISVDRLDYFLRDSFTIGLNTLQNIHNYLSSFKSFEGNLIVKDRVIANSIARNFMKMTVEMWATPFQSCSFKILAEAIKIGFEKGIISQDDIYTTDIELWKKLESSNDMDILKKLDIIKNNRIGFGSAEDYDVHSVSKARYIDPLFFENNKILRLSEADKEFAKEIEEFKQKINKGFYIKVLK